jgi:two-component system LytT family sensor kinase
VADRRRTVSDRDADPAPAGPFALPGWITRRAVLVWVAGFVAAVLVLAASAAVVLYVGSLWAGRETTVVEALIGGSADWCLWLVLAPVVLWLAWRFPIGTRPWLPNVAVHLAAGLGVALVDVAAFTWIYRATGVAYTEEPTYFQACARAASLWLHWGLLVYWALVAGFHAVAYFRRAQQREIQTAQLESQLARAQLAALQMQLNPHFLFNTLHTIATYVRDQRRAAAVDLIAALGDLLRAALEGADSQEVTLAQDLSFVRKYLEIERQRFGDRLQVRIQVADPLLEARVPTMILQPLVENALRYGIGNPRDGGLVEIRADREDGTLVLRVRDNGAGFPAVPLRPADSHLGLLNTRGRLERLYGSGGCLDVGNHPEGGAVVTVRLPWHTEPLRAPAG